MCARFFIYRAVLGRVTHLVIEGKRTRHIPDWLKDHGIRQPLAAVLSGADLKALLECTPPVAMYRMQNALEAAILEEISRITSGKRSALESFENARELRAALAGESAGA